MAVGQAVLAGAWDVRALRAAEGRLEARAADAGRVHVALLRDVLAVHQQYSAMGMPLSSQAQIALLLRCSELRAGKLLNDALGLVELPEALAALEWGLLTVEQSSVVVAQLAVLSLPDRLRVWQRLLERLRRDVEQGAVLPPARLTDLLRSWVLEVDQDAARERREQAEHDRRVEYRRRDDGLADLFLIGLRAPLAQAVLQRIRDESAPVSLWDERTADQRRLDAAVDLLLGRTGSRCKSDCGCLPGTPGLCGTDVAVLVPLPAALGAGDEPAELVGHGPIDSALLQDLLASAPRLRPVFVDEEGVPVAVADRVLIPERGDPASLRRTLLQLSEMRPARCYPRHPQDHPPKHDGAHDVGPPVDEARPPADDRARARVVAPGRRRMTSCWRGQPWVLPCPGPARTRRVSRAPTASRGGCAG